MNEAVVLNTIPYGDHQAALAINHRLGDCQTRGELNQVLKTALIPLMDCCGAFYVRLGGERNSLQLLDDINQSSLCHHGWKNFLEVAKQTQLLTSPSTGEMSSRLATDAFCCIDHSLRHVKSSCAMVALFDAPKPAIAFYLCRLKPQEQDYTRRDFELLQILRATLLQTIKAVTFQEQCQNFQQMMDHLSGQTEPLAMVRGDGVLVYKNHAYDLTVDQEIFTHLKTALTQASTTVSGKTEQHYFHSHLGRRLYKATLKLVNDSAGDRTRLYLLSFSRVSNKNGQIFRQWSQTGLTDRELQIAALLYQGIPTRNIADQLCLSYHTIRNHIKHIYCKIGVTSRSEMLIWGK